MIYRNTCYSFLVWADNYSRYKKNELLFLISPDLINRYKKYYFSYKFLFFVSADVTSRYKKNMELTPTRGQNFEQHASTRKISTAPSYSHDVIISFSTTPSYLLWSSPLSLLICTAPGPLLSLSISIGDCSGDHPMP
jgi:hypothetical protein